jgi:hypothetical protein|tara:strand:+ start:28418 stop:28558 length:141 start_codon:yes stop_codon:yes gene_type:complete
VIIAPAFPITGSGKFACSPPNGGNFKPMDNILDELNKAVIQKIIDE